MERLLSLIKSTVSAAIASHHPGREMGDDPETVEIDTEFGGSVA